MIVLTRPAQTDSRLVRKLPHAQHRNGAKITRKSLPDGDREWTGLGIRGDEEGLDRCDEQHQRLDMAVPRLKSGQDPMVKHEFVNNKDHLGQGLDDDEHSQWQTWYDREGGSSGMSM